MPQKPAILGTSISHAIIAIGEQPDGPKTTQAAVGDAFLASPATGARILMGEWDGLFEQVRHAAHSPLGPAVVAALFAGSTRWVVGESRPSGDLDGDGDVDKGDVLTGGIKAMHLLATQLEAVQRHAFGRRYTQPQQAEINALLAAAITTLGRVGQAVNQLTTCGAVAPRGEP